LNSGLTQVLDDGENIYTYGLGRISQTSTTTEYFLGDARAAIFLENNQALLNFKHIPNNSPYHAEVFLYKKFNGNINGVGVSHLKGPCMENPYFCKKFFIDEGFQNVFWTGLWK
jgi:hypothetical protein